MTNDHDMILEEVSARQEASHFRSEAICSAGWHRVLMAPPEQLANATAEAWQLEAIHAKSSGTREAARQAARTWRQRAAEASAA